MTSTYGSRSANSTMSDRAGTGARPEPSTVNAGQVRLARFRVLRDESSGRPTPDLIRRIASIKLPGDPASA